jgi:hypothetical protein
MCSSLVPEHEEHLLFMQVILVAKRGTSGEEGENGRRFLYESGRKHLLCSDPLTICS